MGSCRCEWRCDFQAVAGLRGASSEASSHPQCGQERREGLWVGVGYTRRPRREDGVTDNGGSYTGVDQLVVEMDVGVWDILEQYFVFANHTGGAEEVAEIGGECSGRLAWPWLRRRQSVCKRLIVRVIRVCMHGRIIDERGGRVRGLIRVLGRRGGLGGGRRGLGGRDVSGLGRGRVRRRVGWGGDGESRGRRSRSRGAVVGKVVAGVGGTNSGTGSSRRVGHNVIGNSACTLEGGAVARRGRRDFKSSGGGGVGRRG